MPTWTEPVASDILVKNQIINFNSASELLNLMAAKNFTISHFLKICIEDNLLNNFYAHDGLNVAAKVFLFFQMSTVFPLIMYLLRYGFMLDLSSFDSCNVLRVDHVFG